ncbi:hypothetical protein HDU93_005209 [Gonapodya sp. JEL0774]|nr:hypothetical protein HDU93_005209 [Gonapodya sp. JEL0774]
MSSSAITLHGNTPNGPEGEGGTSLSAISATNDAGKTIPHGRREKLPLVELMNNKGQYPTDHGLWFPKHWEDVEVAAAAGEEERKRILSLLDFYSITHNDVKDSSAGLLSERQSKLGEQHAREEAANVGFIGLGQMGFPMAVNLQKHVDANNGTLFVNDFLPETSKRFVDTYKAHVASPADIVANCDVIITMLPGPLQVRSLYSEMAKGAKQDQLFIDSSTIDATTIVDASKWMAEKGAFAIDAPVSGGTGGATKGTLTFMVGAPSTPKDFFSERVEPVLKPMAGKIWNCGVVGSGQTAKIANNMILGVSMIAVSEAMNLGIRGGVDAAILAQIVNSSSGRCWSSDTYNPVPGVMENVPSARGYDGGFGVKLMQKDLGLALEAAKATNSTCMVGSLAWQIYTQAPHSTKLMANTNKTGHDRNGDRPYGVSSAVGGAGSNLHNMKSGYPDSGSMSRQPDSHGTLGSVRDQMGSTQLSRKSSVRSNFSAMSGISWHRMSAAMSFTQSNSRRTSISSQMVVDTLNRSIHSGSFRDLNRVESDYCRDFFCCGRQIESLHELWAHYEEAHPDSKLSSAEMVENAHSNLATLAFAAQANPHAIPGAPQASGTGSGSLPRKRFSSGSLTRRLNDTNDLLSFGSDNGSRGSIGIGSSSTTTSSEAPISAPLSNSSSRKDDVMSLGSLGSLPSLGSLSGILESLSVPDSTSQQNPPSESVENGNVKEVRVVEVVPATEGGINAVVSTRSAAVRGAR